MSSKPDPNAAQANDDDDLDTQVLGRLPNRGDVGRAENLKTTALTEAGANALVGDGNVHRTGMPPAEAVEPESCNNDQTADNPASIDFASVDETASGTAFTVTPEVASVLHVPGIGQIDLLDYHQILGWVWFPTAPDEPVDVEILVDSVVVLTARADQFRRDLLKMEVGNGCHGFLVQNLETHIPPGIHHVRVLRARDGQELPGSPRWVERPKLASEEDKLNSETDVVDGSQHNDRLLTEAGRAGTEPHPQSRRAHVAAPIKVPSPVAPIVAAEAAAILPMRAAGIATGEQDATARRGSLPIGSIDRVGYDEISGWAWDSTRPDESVDIEILDGDVVVLKVIADEFRLDLREAGAGGGYHAFYIRNLTGVFPLSRHRVRVRRAIDGRDLPNSPMWISRPRLDDQAMAFMDEVMVSAVQAAETPDDLAQPLGVLLRLINELINAQDSLARTLTPPLQAPLTEIRENPHLTDRTRELVDNLRYAFAPLHFEPSDQPEVSVIIPVHNKFFYTYQCLKSIGTALPKRPFEIIIVDDCSDDETILSALVFSGAVRILRNTRNLGFVRTCNAGAAVAKGNYLFFLNNDTLVKEGWLDELVETFEQVPNVGIAGSKLLFADGTLQEAGGIIWRLGDGWNWGRGRDPTEPALSFLRDADWVSGAALMIERTMFDELGGFDELYAPAYYEDTDLAFRVRARRKRVVVQPASEIIHLEGISAGTDTSGPGMKRFQVINHAKFYQRWKDTLITHRFNGQQPELEAERLVRRRAYFIDDTVPTPDQDAGSNAAVEHMRALMALGYKVTFLPADNMAKIDPYTAYLQKIGIECQYHPFYWSVEEVFRKTANNPDLVYLHRYNNASKYGTMVRRYFPECRIVYSVADLHFLRMERQAEIEPGTTTAAQVVLQRRVEMSAMQSADCVIVHSPVEAALLHEAEPLLNVKVVPWTVRPQPAKLPFAERSGAAFVGGFGHPPNSDAVRHLVGDILPLLRRRLPDFTTYLVGSKMPDEFMSIQLSGVVPLGFVSVLGDILHKLRCTMVPLRFGAGIKGKVLESFAHGLPCVMTEVAAEGLELPEDLALLVARTPADFVKKLVRVHEDEAFNRRLSEAGLAYIERRHSAAVVKEALRAAVVG